MGTIRFRSEERESSTAQKGDANRVREGARLDPIVDAQSKLDRTGQLGRARMNTLRTCLLLCSVTACGPELGDLDPEWSEPAGSDGERDLVPPELEGCAADVSEEDIADHARIAFAFAGMANSLAVYGRRTVELCTAIQTHVATSVEGEWPAESLEGWSYEGNGTYRTVAPGVEVELRIHADSGGGLSFDTSITVDLDAGWLVVAYHARSVTSDVAECDDALQLTYEMVSATAQRPDLGQSIEVDPWIIDFTGHDSALDGIIEARVRGGRFDYDLTTVFEHSAEGETTLSCASD